MPKIKEPSQKRFNLVPWIKLVLGGVVVAYVLKSRLIDFESLKEILFSPGVIAFSFFFLASTTLACCFRWYLLVRAQGIRASFWGMLELMMIGTFFNLFMPGAVGGDLIKGWYIAREQPQKRTRAVFTVVIDRAIGLAVFIFSAAITLGIFSDWLVGKPALQALAAPIWGMSAALVIGTAFFFSPLWESSLNQKLVSFVRRSSFLSKIIDAGTAYRENPGTILAAFLISMGSVTVNILFYYWLGQKLGIQSTLTQFFFLVPVGVTASAVPLLPGGIGVGQVAFFKLFQWVGIPDPELGSTLCTVTQIYTVLFGCLGSVFYFKYRKKIPSVSEVDQNAVDQSDRHLSRNLR